MNDANPDLRFEQTAPRFEQTWESVIAAMEDNVRRTELAARERAQRSVPGTVAPSETLLPAWVVAPMPPVSAMPPVPPEVAERIRLLQKRIDELAALLRDELSLLRPSVTALHGPRTRLATPIDAPARPHFIDSIA